MALNGARDFTIHGGAHNIVYGHQYNTSHYHNGPDDAAYLLQKLAEHAAPNATHYAGARYPLPNCHPNTRLKPLETLGNWIKDERKSIRVYWVNGSAGVGKSAIAQRISEDFESWVIATFFFSRNDPTRDNLDRFVATIAYQCCTSQELRDVIGSLIVDAIRSDPNIFLTSSENQFRKLLLEPFARLALAQRQSLPNLIIADGLDECIDPKSQRRLIEMVDLAITYSVPSSFPFTFLLCSRREPNLRNALDRVHFAICREDLLIHDASNRSWEYFSRCDRQRMQEQIKRLQHNDYPDEEIQRLTGILDSDLDIHKYFVREFARLRRELSPLRYEDQAWPGEDVIWDLVWRASGQFVFAVTVINFVDTSDELPQDRLEMVLGTESGDVHDSPYPDLDMLYRQIVSRCRHWEKIRPILRLLLSSHPEVAASLGGTHATIKWRSPSIITGLFKLKPEDPDLEIHIVHASFTEFLLKYCELTAVFLLRTLALYTSQYPLYCPPGEPFHTTLARWQARCSTIEDDSLLLYACRSWPSYCCRVTSPSADLRAGLNGFEPLAVGALTLMTRKDGCSAWHYCVEWAKSLAEPPHVFIENTEMFLNGFNVAYPKDCYRDHAIRHILYMEHRLMLNNPANLDAMEDAFRMVTFTLRYYRDWWKVIWDKKEVYPLLLPATSDASEVLPNPEDWAVVPVTKSGAVMIKRVRNIYDRFRGSRDVFDKDIINNTSESVARDWIQEEDLAEFKKVVYERRDSLWADSNENANPMPETALPLPQTKAWPLDLQKAKNPRRTQVKTPRKNLPG
ncbi:hypothetical protein VNI00_008788 [Paramarasmius palmivorus]|uniref:Nephrocystin 3-like N-terminal domain-containing protein n=1 Tax=Paramarasmius palmivorus TaxID=297713 RepID=A0AAW0CXQ8_9AGAR